MGTGVMVAVAVAVVALVFALFLSSRISQSKKRIQSLEESIDGLSSQIYQIQKELKSAMSHQKFLESQDGVNENLNSFYHQIKRISEIIQSDRNYFEEKIIRLESRIRDFGQVGMVNDIDEKRIISLYREGWSIDSIAKELRIGRGEVEFTLKLADI